MVGREGFEVGFGSWEGKTFLNDVTFQGVQPDPTDLGHGMESFRGLLYRFTKGE